MRGCRERIPADSANRDENPPAPQGLSCESTLHFFRQLRERRDNRARRHTSGSRRGLMPGSVELWELSLVMGAI